ncbi:MAG: beta-galactosidase trimerization domain-containing protein [Labilithrix sp.]|nr:beta-galactosidase trimerization domain-containing protein [Labilithrix sp.]
MAHRTRLALTLTLALSLPSGCSDDARTEAPIAMLPPAPWLAGATLAGLELPAEASSAAVDRALDELHAENVSAVVLRSPMAEHYRSDAELDVDLRLARLVSDRAHRRGMRVLWTMPTLAQRDASGEVPAIAREHPDWLQLPLEARFESDGALLCPLGPARDWLLARVRRVARSGVDGILLEAPTLAPLRGEAALLCPEQRARFEADTGFGLPTRVPCDDPYASVDVACEEVWRQPAWAAFLRHRHVLVAELEAAIADAAREAYPDVLAVIQERAFDTNLATDRGADATFARQKDGLHRLWDVPVPSGTEGMRRATPDDWIQRIAMLKLARGVDRERASVASSAGASEWDAGLALGTTFAAQASPWEQRSGIPHAGVARELRTRAFAWAREHLPAIQSARSAARVAVIQSSASRDLVDFGYGSGTFASAIAPLTGVGQRHVVRDSSWFAADAADGAGALEAVGELRGMIKALSHLHVPFDVLPAETLTAADLSKYRLVVAPDVVAVSDAAANAVRELVARGGAALSSGLGVWGRDELGRARPELAVGDLFGMTRASNLGADATASRAACSHVEALFGRRYLRYGDELSLDRIRDAIDRAEASPIATDAPRDVWLDLLEGDGELLVSVVNLTGASSAGGQSAPLRVKIDVEVARRVAGASVTSPDPGAHDRDVAVASPEPGVVSFEVDVSEYSLVRLRLGAEPVRRAPRAEGAPAIAALGESSGLAGHSVALRGSGFGHAEGTVTWGGAPCVVTAWHPDAVACWLPHDAAPGTADVVLHRGGASSNAVAFTVVAPRLTASQPMKDAFSFIKTKMRSSFGGVFTNFKDRVDEPGSNEVYPYGHHQTAEHLGLFLWVAAALEDHAAFEQAFAFLSSRMLSPRLEVVNWAIDKTTGTPMLHRDDPSGPLLNSNAPLDDFRVVNGLVAGWEQWRDPRYRWAALRIGNALLETSTTVTTALPEFPEGVVAYAYNWPEGRGRGATDYEVIPIDYADLWSMRWLSAYDPRWNPVIDASVRLMERASLPVGHFYNSYLTETRALSGDFEFRDTIAGQKIKAIQSLWTAIHLARVGQTAPARRALDFYEKVYAERGRVAEYLNYDGSEVTEPELASSLAQGEARIYAQLVRLAYYLGDKTFGDKVITEKIVTDQVDEPTSALFGNIGKSSTDADDAEAWNTLEALLALALQRDSAVVAHVYR